MSKQQYLDMCEQMGEEPDWDKCPPDWEDFPEIVITAVNIFHSLGERIYGDVGYIGKDYTNLNLLLSHYQVEEHNREFVLDTILILESRAITNAQRKLKAEYDRLKNK